MSANKDVVDYLSRKSSRLEIAYPYWIRGCAEEDWCRACGLVAARHLRRRAKRGEKQNYILDGGYCGGDEDGCTRCAGCGCLLHYTLTDYGVENELSHFISHWNPIGPIHPETAYELASIFYGAEDRVDLSEGINLLFDRVLGVMEVEECQT